MVVKQKEEPIPEEEQEAVEGDIEDKLNSVLKALAELQTAIKDLATSIGAGFEAVRGLKESLLGEVSNLKGEIVKPLLEKVAGMEETLKQLTVGLQAAAATNAKFDLPLAKKPDVPQEPKTIKEEVVAPPEQVKEPAEHLYKKEHVEVVKAERSGVEVRKSEMSKTSEIITDILFGRLKGKEFINKAREVVGV